MAIHVGIGSWADPEYVGLLYPKGTPAGEKLKLYATWFDHVEINSSYYGTPRREVVEEWVKQTPANFRFQVKLHRAISQSPKKAASGELPAALLHNLEPLIAAKKLGTLLLVLPPSFGPKKHRLEELDALAERLQPHPLAIELRDNAWVAGAERARTFDYFRSRRLVWVAVDMPQVEESTIMPAVDEVTHPEIAYIRLHGRNPGWFQVKEAAERHHYAYPSADLQEIAGRIAALAQGAKAVYAVCNNHAEDFAPKAALALRERLGLPRPAT
jgi:uncharacterized protein YecE (DUF72 family)